MRIGLYLAVVALCACGSVQGRSKHHTPTNRSGKFDYYVMSLSWSPSFCDSHRSNPQCSQHFGFVLHGLWPENDSGSFPQNCPTSEVLTDEARNLGKVVYPTQELMVHEWGTHGTCNGTSALDYFKSAQSAFASITVPAQLQPGAASESMTGPQIATLLRDSNPSVTADELVVICSSHELSEVRICLSKGDLKPRVCGSKVTGNCGSTAIKIPGVQGSPTRPAASR